MAISEKQKQLIELYKQMAADGYATVHGKHISNAFDSMEIRAFRKLVNDALRRFSIETALDYGCGDSHYDRPGFDGTLSAREYFGLKAVYRYEPARDIDERRPVDAVFCFDVLEHVFIADVVSTIRELFSLANKLLVVNVACYPAVALLPNGENAHITVRPPQWWKGVFDMVACEFPDVSVMLICSTAWRKGEFFQPWSATDWHNSPTFCTQV